MFPSSRSISSSGEFGCDSRPTENHPSQVLTQTDLPSFVGRYRVRRLLGQGGFGLVYLAHDDQLDRLVAIKVPHARRLESPELARLYVREARMVASLDHPHIVPVYDVGSTSEFPCYLVSKYIDGASLATGIKQRIYPFREAAELAATVAEALHHAHTHRLVHRDIKPGNILIDQSGRPFVVDFGTALREHETELEGAYVGTPAYMSPEQARGEGHRVDGRSDVFSLGVVLYEMLTGRRPFSGATLAALLTQIASAEPVPPRQIADHLPKELERICLRALAKRATDRFTTAKDFADDLRHFLDALPRHSSASARVLPESTIEESSEGQTEGGTTRAVFLADSGHPPRVVPKGLHSFDVDDADCFLELLPGPRDRDGLPESVRFWKSRIEETDPDRSFTVGLLYGPSGCGKTSLLKAGLLPRLSERIVVVHVECAGEDTELRLRRKLMRRCPSLTPGQSLREALAAIRRGTVVPADQKVLLVLDQFEQWLHFWRDGRESELVDGLRQCDGVHLQCLVLVRDDFYIAVSRLFRELEVPILEGRNYRLVDLFDLQHARRVLTAFGKAYGRLPVSDSELTSRQQVFLRRAVDGLAQGEKVVSVRLALFAEMMKSRSWSPESLREVGGPEGVGVTFLEETFSSQTAPPTHRMHQRAARAVLQALLPEQGADIKGQMQSFERLLVLSGYRDQPDDFEALLQILERDLRLICPTEPESPLQSGSVPESVPGGRYYQLTHDFLIPQIRDWLSRKQRETWRGRSELRLAERAALWTGKPERRQLPSWGEWLGIRLLTRPALWTAAQRRMMRVATRHHVLRMVLGCCLVLAGVSGGLAVRGLVSRQAHLEQVDALVERLWSVDVGRLPGLLDELDRHRNLWQDEVAELLTRRDIPADQRTRAHLALVRRSPASLNYLAERLFQADAPEHAVIRRELKRDKDLLLPQLWKSSLRERLNADNLIRVSCALAEFDPANDQWTALAPRLTKALVQSDPLLADPWLHVLFPARAALKPSLVSAFTDRSARESERLLAASIIVRYASTDDRFLNGSEQLQLLTNADASQCAVLFPLFQARRAGTLSLLEQALNEPVPLLPDPPMERRIEGQANAAEVLLRLGKGERFWELLKQNEDPRVRSLLIDRIHSSRVSLQTVLDRLEHEADGGIRQAMILGLAPFGAELSGNERRNVAERVLDLYSADPDGGVHSAAEWLLIQWGFESELESARAKIAGRPAEHRGWFVDTHLHTMLVIDAPGTTKVGSPEYEIGRDPSEAVQVVLLDYPFAISAHEVTFEQFVRYRDDTSRNDQVSPDDRCPVNFVSWYDAARYCRWLSEQEQIPEHEMCYPPIEQIGPGMELPSDHVRRSGYRLPTPFEWEIAARAGSATSRFFGNSESLLDDYAWYSGSAQERTWPVGQLRPNPLGLFDVYGNVSEWCDLAPKVHEPTTRLIRGGMYRSTPKFLRSAMAEKFRPDSWLSFVGFRVARGVRHSPTGQR